MKTSILLIFILTTSLFAAAQTQSPNFGTCFTKANKKSIVNKMDNFLTRVSEETNCPKEKLTYTVTEYYTVFYTKTCRHLPKKITFEACGQKRTYKHNGLSGAIFLLAFRELDFGKINSKKCLYRKFSRSLF